MRISENILWTALPAGRDGELLNLSVFVSPRIVLNPKQSVCGLEQCNTFSTWTKLVKTEIENGTFSLRIAFVNEQNKVVNCDTDAYDFDKTWLKGLDPALWNKLFPRSVPVNSYEFPGEPDARIYSYPAEDIVSTAQKIYSAVAVESPHTVPGMSRQGDGMAPLKDFIRHVGSPEMYYAFSNIYSPLFAKEKTVTRSRFLEVLNNPNIIEDEDTIKQIRRELEKFRKYGKDLKEVFNEYPEAVDFFLAYRFYNRPKAFGQYNTPKPDWTIPRVPMPRPDFHQMIASLADHPAILRKLGLVIALKVIPPPGILSRVRVTPAEEWEHRFPRRRSLEIGPWTACEITPSSFTMEYRAASQGNAPSRLGRVDLSAQAGRFVPVLIDPDGTSLKMFNFAGSTYPLVQTPADIGVVKTIPSVPDTQGIPALNTAGIAIMEKERAENLREMVTRSAPVDTALYTATGPDITVPDSIPTLYADDLTRGFRVDVWDDSLDPADKAWRPLCRRRVNYYRMGSSEKLTGEVDDEGYVKAASTTTNQQESGANHYLHGALFRWNGWSLCAQRPGRILVDTPGQHDVTEVKHSGRHSGEAVTDGLNLNPAISVEPGTLPALRFGHRYRLRAREVNIAGDSEGCHAGNCDGFTEVWKGMDDLTASDPITFLRFEPVSPPALVPRHPYSIGESAECMVIRSDYHRAVKEYFEEISDTFGKQFVNERILQDTNPPGGPVRLTCERHVAPPKTSQMMAETHGMFDHLLAAGDFEGAKKIALTESGTFDDTVAGFTEKIEYITPDPGDAVTEAKHYTVHREAHITVPYLPDPLVTGAAFRNLPGQVRRDSGGPESITLPDTGETVQKIPYAEETRESPVWPDGYSAFRIVLSDVRPGVGHPAEVAWEDAGGVAGFRKRALSVHLPPGEIVRVLYSSYPDSADLDLHGIWDWMKAKIKKQYPEEPLRTAMLRKYQTYPLSGSHQMITPYRELVLVHAVQHPLRIPEIGNIAVLDRGIGKTEAVFDTSTFHLDLKSTGRLDLWCNWTEYIDDIRKDTWEERDHTDHVFDAKIEYPSKDRMNRIPSDYPDLTTFIINQPHPVIGDRKWIGQYRHEFGDTRHRVVQYYLRATTRFREFFPESFPGDTDKARAEIEHFSVTGTSFRPVIINSSARPPAPKILYVIPTFEWGPVEETRSPGRHSLASDHTVEIRRTRFGRGLRVYLDRPWFASGEGEQLGVVLWQEEPGHKIPDNLKPFVTQCGMDPLWWSGTVNAFLTPEDFPLAVSRDTRSPTLVSDDQIDYQRVSIAGHTVNFDPDRKLLYCDIEVLPGETYFPFVRLALARYQPHSIDNCHISAVVLADFAQLTPDRTATLCYTSFRSEIKSVTVTVSGLYPADIPVFSGISQFPRPQVPTGSVDMRILVQLEAPDPALPNTNRDPALGWRAVGSPVSLSPVSQGNGRDVSRARSWTGAVDLPGPSVQGPFRITIKEYEYITGDRTTTAMTGLPVQVKEPRLVYADVLYLRPLP